MKGEGFSPASLSFIFQFSPGKSLEQTGSLGIGCTLDKIVKVEVQPASQPTIFFNGQTINFPTVESVVQWLSPRPVSVKISSPLPLGFGFGISAASALGCAFALNKLWGLKKEREELAKIAHRAEVFNATGLGSVTTQITGGFLLKTAPGFPVKARTLPFIGKKIYATILEKLPTPLILRDKRKLAKINFAAQEIFAKIKKKKEISLEEILDLSFLFVQKSGLLTSPKVRKIIKEIQARKGAATLAMVGEVVLSNLPPKKEAGLKIEELTISAEKAK